ncbi:MAG TPA: hypothetical protein VF627_11610 [Abditibacterium sp.]|jgi:hypothetical protein
MKKACLLVAVALCASVNSSPASAQDTFGIDAGGTNHLLNYAQIKHKSPGALDPLSVRSRYLKRKRAAAARKYRGTRTTRYAGKSRRTAYRLRR